MFPVLVWQPTLPPSRVEDEEISPQTNHGQYAFLLSGLLVPIILTMNGYLRRLNRALILSTTVVDELAPEMPLTAVAAPHQGTGPGVTAVAWVSKDSRRQAAPNRLRELLVQRERCHAGGLVSHSRAESGATYG